MKRVVLRLLILLIDLNVNGYRIAIDGECHCIS